MHVRFGHVGLRVRDCGLDFPRAYGLEQEGLHDGRSLIPCQSAPAEAKSFVLHRELWRLRADDDILSLP